MAHALFDGRVGRDGLKAAKIAAVTAFTQRVDLNMAYLADVAVTADKNTAVGDDSRAGAAMDAHQNRVFAILTRTKVVLRQRKAANIVTHKTGDFKAFFQCFNQPQFST